MTLALLRAIKTSGEVYYDGLPTSEINLEVLRSNITLIPQQPELMHGTLRENLDPFGQHDDATLNNALQAAGLYDVHVKEDEEAVQNDANKASFPARVQGAAQRSANAATGPTPKAAKSSK